MKALNLTTIAPVPATFMLVAIPMLDVIVYC